MSIQNRGALTVLLVDDEVFLVDELAEYLSKRGFGVLKAYGARAALETLARDGGGAVTHLLLDLRMPDVDGFGFLGLIDRPRLAELFVIAVSGHPTTEDEVRAKALGADVFLKKPFCPEDILGLLH